MRLTGVSGSLFECLAEDEWIVGDVVYQQILLWVFSVVWGGSIYRLVQLASCLGVRIMCAVLVGWAVA